MAPRKKPKDKLKPTAKYYRDHPESREKKKQYDTRTQSDEKNKAKRRELGRKRTQAKKHGKDIEGKDYDHKQKRFMDSSKNRGQREKSRLKGSKRGK